MEVGVPLALARALCEEGPGDEEALPAFPRLTEGTGQLHVGLDWCSEPVQGQRKGEGFF